MINSVKNLQLIDLSLFPELFIGFSCVFLVIFHSFVCLNSNYNYLLTARPFYALSSLIIFDALLLLMNDSLIWLFKYNSLNNFISINILTSFIKFLLLILTLYCFLSLDTYIIKQKNNYFGEYSIIILYSILGLLLILSLHDLLSIFLSIEIQSVAFYLLASYKKESLYSVHSDLKYLILGAASSSFFLFGSCYLYGLVELFKFYDFNVFWSVKQVLNQISSYFVIWETNSITLLSLCYLLATAEFLHRIYLSTYSEFNACSESIIEKTFFFNSMNVAICDADPWFINDKNVEEESSRTLYCSILSAVVWDAERSKFFVQPFCLAYVDNNDEIHVRSILTRIRQLHTPSKISTSTENFYLDVVDANNNNRKITFEQLFESDLDLDSLELYDNSMIPIEYKKQLDFYFKEVVDHCSPLGTLLFDNLNPVEFCIVCDVLNGHDVDYFSSAVDSNDNVSFMQMVSRCHRVIGVIRGTNNLLYKVYERTDNFDMSEVDYTLLNDPEHGIMSLKFGLECMFFGERIAIDPNKLEMYNNISKNLHKQSISSEYVFASWWNFEEFLIHNRKAIEEQAISKAIHLKSRFSSGSKS